MKPELIYVGDPICVWCYGIAPVLKKIKQEFMNEISFSIVVGGLRVRENAQPLDDKFKDFLAPHWNHVSDLTGQFINPDIMAREGFIIDTEWADRAFVAGRSFLSNSALDVFEFISQLFYVDNRDISDAQTFRKLPQRFEIDESQFMNALLSKENEQETWSEFRLARRLGATGFPTLLLRTGERVQTLSRGYQSFDILQEKLQQLTQQYIKP